MENASRALLIAGGVLFAIIVVTLLVILWSNMSMINNTMEESKRIQQISDFNKGYESYQSPLLRGTDVATVINKVRSNNSKYADNADYYITWKLVLEDDAKLSTTDIYLKKGTYTESSNNSLNADYQAVMTNTKYFENFKQLYFKCTGITYNSKTGRIKTITFKKYTQETVNSWL